MAITTLDLAISGMQKPEPFAKGTTGTMVSGRPHSSWRAAGLPIAGATSATLNGDTLIAPVVGQLDRHNPASGNAYLARFEAQVIQPCALMLIDRLWHNGGYAITATTAQAIVSPAWPMRDKNAATLGEGVLLGLEVITACGAAAPLITVEYTNSAGVSDRIGANIYPTANSPPVGAFYPIELQDGDVGVRSVQSLTLSVSWISGTIALVAYRPIALLDITTSNTPNAADAISLGLPQIYDNSVLSFIMIPEATSNSTISGHLIETHG
ncbi:hypothetical protein [Phenylobacterium sp.]|uniref:hypothetical protein n=1 Tax=Phenylobacterium sp. TaxID=1871053 RepID=UPI002733E0B5|nr:hypothetical protein [Phenylobacterium sp.]MDP3855332.1 hypothetical protein [Phenylobacterium sp.]